MIGELPTVAAVQVQHLTADFSLIAWKSVFYEDLLSHIGSSKV